MAWSTSSSWGWTGWQSDDDGGKKGRRRERVDGLIAKEDRYTNKPCVLSRKADPPLPSSAGQRKYLLADAFVGSRSKEVPSHVAPRISSTASGDQFRIGVRLKSQEIAFKCSSDVTGFN